MTSRRLFSGEPSDLPRRPPEAAAPRISVVLFDLDDTLFAHREAVEFGIIAHRGTLGDAIAAADEAAEVARWNELEEHHYHRYLAGELEDLGQRRERARGFVAPFGIELTDAEAEAWFRNYLTQYERGWALHDDVLPCLDALAPARFGVITNGDLAFQQAKVAATGLTERVEFVVASGELGVTKPDPQIFLHACALYDVTPAEACYVGDRLQTDALGAAAAGLRGVWLDRHGVATPAQLDAAAAAGVAVIRTLAELPPLLA